MFSDIVTLVSMIGAFLSTVLSFLPYAIGTVVLVVIVIVGVQAYRHGGWPALTVLLGSLAGGVGWFLGRYPLHEKKPVPEAPKASRPTIFNRRPNPNKKTRPTIFDQFR
jgi:hypothetical protein